MSGSSSGHSEYVPSPKKMQYSTYEERFTRQEMERIILEKDQKKWCFKTIKQRHRKLNAAQDISRIRKLLQTPRFRATWKDIEQFVLLKFTEAENVNLPIHDYTIKDWVLQKCEQGKFDRLNASAGWILNFKKKHKIRSKKITKFVTKTAETNKEQLLKDVEEFRVKFKHMLAVNNYSQVFNADQTGYIHTVLLCIITSN